MIRVIIADDHLVVRNGIKLLLTEDPLIEIVYEASNGQQVLNALEGGLVADVVLTDFTMPIMDGFAMLEILAEKHPAISVVFLSMLNDRDLVSRAVNAGALGYLYKSCSAMELIFAIKFVYQGARYLCAELGFNLLQEQPVSASVKDSVKGLDLSDREQEILYLIADGLTNAEIGSRLFISKRTAEGHRQELLRKTGAKSSANMVKIAMENNMFKR